MIDNYLQDSYHSWDLVYTSQQYKSSLYIGDVQSALDLQFLKDKNIKTVVTAAKGMDHITYDQTITHIIYPLLDAKNQNIACFFDAFFQLVQTHLLKSSILVHCAVGISRSSTLVISYIMKKQKLSFKKAIDFVRKSRPSVLPNLGFERQLKKYEQILIKSAKYTRGTNSRQSSKAPQSSSHQLQTKTQFLPVLRVAAKPRVQEKYLTINSKYTSEKTIDKDSQILRIYGNSKNDHEKKRLLASKKPVSFCRDEEKRREGTKSTHAQPSDNSQPLKNIKQQKAKRLKTPIEKIRQIYLTKKDLVFPENKQTVHRKTFYNLKLKINRET